MSETVEVKQGEVVEAALVTKKEGLASMVKDADKSLLDVMENATLDWKSLKPNQMAVLLMQKPFSVSGGGQTFLTFRQALYFAVRCFELGVSPFSNAVWFDPARFTVNLTLEGKKEVARNRNIDLGPPIIEETSREWTQVPRMTQAATEAKAAGFAKDVACKCRIRVGKPENQEYVNYTAWISEWFVKRSPVWNERPMHMLATRATEKALSLAMGTGASAMVGEEPDGN